MLNAGARFVVPAGRPCLRSQSPVIRTSTRSGRASTRRARWSATTSPSSTIRTTWHRSGVGVCGPPFQFSAWQWQNTYGERPITDTLSALIFDNLFGRFPNIKVLVSEFGAEWVPHFIRHMDKSRGMAQARPLAGWPADGAAERDLQAARARRALPRGRHDQPHRKTRNLRDAADGLGLAACRRICASLLISISGSSRLDEVTRRDFLRENGMKLSSGTG